MIGLALSGGGSRAMAFHLGCLRALNDFGLLDRIRVLSTISGGSVIGAYWAYTPEKDFDKFDAEMRAVLRGGMQLKIGLQMMRPMRAMRAGGNTALAVVDAIAPRVGVPISLPRFETRTDAFKEVLRRRLFGDLRMCANRRSDIDVVIGACELRTGTAFRFGNAKAGSWRYGEMLDWNVHVAFAVAASAAYPLFLPALDRRLRFRKGDKDDEHRVALTDGGVYDNLGVQVLEPGRDRAYSLHSYNCDYLIVCNAGVGASLTRLLPLNFGPRVSRSFEIVHRRVQDSAMNRLHQLKRSGAIKGFAMPYLGQADDALPWKPADLVPRGEVIRYPTDFSAMSDAWIAKLSLRGEQLTRTLVELYLPALL